MSLKHKSDHYIDDRGRFSSAYASTGNAREPLEASITGSDVTPHTLDKMASNAKIHMSVYGDRSVISAESSVGECATMSRDKDMAAAALGQKCQTKTTKDGAMSVASGRHRAMAVAASREDGGTVSAMATTWEGKGGRAMASGTSARVMSWGPGGVEITNSPTIFERIVSMLKFWNYLPWLSSIAWSRNEETRRDELYIDDGRAANKL